MVKLAVVLLTIWSVVESIKPGGIRISHHFSGLFSVRQPCSMVCHVRSMAPGSRDQLCEELDVDVEEVGGEP